MATINVATISGVHCISYQQATYQKYDRLSQKSPSGYGPLQFGLGKHIKNTDSCMKQTYHVSIEQRYLKMFYVDMHISLVCFFHSTTREVHTEMLKVNLSSKCDLP